MPDPIETPVPAPGRRPSRTGVARQVDEEFATLPAPRSPWTPPTPERQCKAPKRNGKPCQGRIHRNSELYCSFHHHEIELGITPDIGGPGRGQGAKPKRKPAEIWNDLFETRAGQALDVWVDALFEAATEATEAYVDVKGGTIIETDRPAHNVRIRAAKELKEAFYGKAVAKVESSSSIDPADRDLMLDWLEQRKADYIDGELAPDPQLPPGPTWPPVTDAELVAPAATSVGHDGASGQDPDDYAPDFAPDEYEGLPF